MNKPTDDNIIKLRQIAQELAPEPLTDQSADEVANEPPPRWIIPDFISEDSVTVFYGPPGSGKSFFSIHLAGALARGITFNGFPTRKCSVVYIALEGRLQLRIRAYKAIHKAMNGQGKLIENFLARLRIPSTRTLNLIEDADRIIDYTNTVAASFPDSPVVVFIDTTARALAGRNENSAEDMGLLISAIDRIRSATPAKAFVLVHHSGKDTTKGERGSSALRGAIDASYEFEEHNAGRADRFFAVTCRKHRDADFTPPFVFTLHVVDLGSDPAWPGRVLSSCAVQFMDRSEASRITRAAREPSSGNAKAIFRIVQKNNPIKEADLLRKAEKDQEFAGVESKVRNQAVRRAIKLLLRDAFINVVELLEGREYSIPAE